MSLCRPRREQTFEVLSRGFSGKVFKDARPSLSPRPPRGPHFPEGNVAFRLSKEKRGRGARKNPARVSRAFLSSFGHASRLPFREAREQGTRADDFCDASLAPFHLGQAKSESVINRTLKVVVRPRVPLEYGRYRYRGARRPHTTRRNKLICVTQPHLSLQHHREGDLDLQTILAEFAQQLHCPEHATRPPHA